MTTLTGRAPKDSYKDLLQVSNANAGVDGTLRSIEDGEGTATLVKVSSAATQLGAATLVDSSENEVIKTAGVASAVNEVTFTNAATGSAPKIEATGGDTVIDLGLYTKGGGILRVNSAPVLFSGDTVTTLNAVVKWGSTNGTTARNSGWSIDSVDAMTAGGALNMNSNAISGVTDLTTTGNTILGNAAADTVTVNAGDISAPNIPSANAYLNATATNVTGDGTFYTIVCDTEVYDQGADYNNTTGTFTAGTAGVYIVTGYVRLDGLTANNTEVAVDVITSNKSFNAGFLNPYAGRGGVNSYFGVPFTVIAYLDAADTAYARIRVSATDKGVDLMSTDATYISFHKLA